MLVWHIETPCSEPSNGGWCHEKRCDEIHEAIVMKSNIHGCPSRMCRRKHRLKNSLSMIRHNSIIIHTSSNLVCICVGSQFVIVQTASSNTHSPACSTREKWGIHLNLSREKKNISKEIRPPKSATPQWLAMSAQPAKQKQKCKCILSSYFPSSHSHRQLRPSALDPSGVTTQSWASAKSLELYGHRLCERYTKTQFVDRWRRVQNRRRKAALQSDRTT